jgi:hypothetical protein
LIKIKLKSKISITAYTFTQTTEQRERTHRRQKAEREREHTPGTMNHFWFPMVPPQAPPQAPPIVANHGAFAPDRTHLQEVSDALEMLTTTYRNIHHGRVIHAARYEGPGTLPPTDDLLRRAFNAHVIVDGSNAAIPALQSSDPFRSQFLQTALTTRIDDLVRGITETAQHIKLVLNFFVVTQDPRVITWWETYIRDQLLQNLNQRTNVLHTCFTLVRAPHGPQAQPGLYEDQLMVDISNTLVGVLEVSDHWSGRVVLMTADGNDRTGDVQFVPGVNGPAEDFPTHIQRVNREFIARRRAAGLETYNPVWHVSPAPLCRTSNRHKWGNALTYGVGGRENVSCPMHQWPMELD